MSYMNTAGPDGTKAALLASNPAAAPPVAEHTHDDLDARITSLEHPHSEHAENEASGDET